MMYQNEFQAAYAVSQATTDYGTVVIPDGMFAVVQCSLAYCRFTDATLRSPYRCVVKLCGTRRVAEFYEAKKIAEMGDGYDGEVWFEVLPKAPQPPMPARVYMDDEIPF